MSWAQLGAIAGPLIAGLALWFATREKKADLLATRTETLVSGQDRRIQSLEDQLEDCERVIAELRREVRELRRQVNQ